MIIGICGKSGSGKSSLSKELINEFDNAVQLEIDVVGHNVLLLDEVINELVNCFGNGILINGSINRKALAELVFNSSDKMQLLTDITWKHMMKEIDDFLVGNGKNIIILDWLLLPKSKYFEMCDLKILLDIPYDIRKSRAIKRDNITEDEFKSRDSSSDEYDKSKFDIVLSNNNYEEVKRMVKKNDKRFISGEF